MVGLCAHPRSFHRRLQPAALRGSSLRGYRHLCLSMRLQLLQSRTALHYMHLAAQEGGLAAQKGVMLHIVIGSLVIHLVGMACLTELQKLAHLIYMETLAQRILASYIYTEGKEDLTLYAVTSTLSWIGERRLS